MNTLNINGYQLITVFWNLFLLIIPYILVVWLKRYRRRTGFKKIQQKIVAVILGFVWLIFIPNTAYIINDVRHLINYCPINSPFRVCAEKAWMIMFFFVYASIGWVAFVYLLNQMKDFIIDLFSKKTAKIFIIGVIPMISLGVLLGLLNRWNSWEIFIYPAEFLRHILVYFTDCVYFGNWLIFTVFLYVLYYGGNYLFKEKFK
jgi:uncharacterized membrane protein